MRTSLAVALTAFVFVQAIRGLRSGHTKFVWFLDPLFHGWLLIAVNVLFYGYICWLGFWSVRGTAGRERFFMAGWFSGFLLWPLKMLQPQWAVATKLIAAFGLAVALLAAVALLLEPPVVPESADPN